MKKLFLTMLVALIAMTSCEKSALQVDDNGVAGDVVTLTVNAETVAGTRALDSYNATSPTNYYLEVWLGTEKYLDDLYSTDGKFTLQLINKQVYTLVAWADYDEKDDAGYYDPTDLTNVTVNPTALAINTLNRDAFAGTKNVTLNENEALTMTLYRPFARVNVATTDYTQIPADFRPTNVVLSYDKIYTRYNVMADDGEGDVITSDTEAVTAAFTSASTTLISADEDGSLSADYLFVPNSGATIEFTATYYKGESEYVTDYTFPNIPIKKNYQTNISGAILTNSGTLTIDVDQNWDGEYLEGAKTFANAEEYNTYINSTNVAGEAEFVITALANGTHNLDVPSTMEATSITITVEEIGESVTLNVGDGTSEYAGTVNLVTPIGTYLELLDVDLPKAHVTFYGYANEGSTYTSPTTFVLLSGSIIGKLTVEGGNAEIEPGATVNEIVTEEGATYTTGIQNTTTGDYFTTIQLALNSATEGDVIELAEGTYTSGFSISKNNITLQGAADTDASAIIISGVSSISNATATIKNFTLTNTLSLNFDQDNAEDQEVTLDGVNIDVVNKTNAISVDYPDQKVININNCCITGYYSNTTYDRDLINVSGYWDNDNILNINNSHFTMIRENTDPSNSFTIIEIGFQVNWAEINVTGETVFEDIYSGISTPMQFVFSDTGGSIGNKANDYAQPVFPETVQAIGALGLRFMASHLDGQGTEEDPYIVAFYDDLSLVNNEQSAYHDSEGYYKQVQDLYYLGNLIERALSYNSLTNNFTGTFDGGGFSIYDFKYSVSSSSSKVESSFTYVGLIPVLGEGGMIKNVNLKTGDQGFYFYPYKSSAQTVGTIVGTCYGTVENCTSDMDIKFKYDKEGAMAGGIVGNLAEGGVIKGCTYTGSITDVDGNALVNTTVNTITDTTL